MKSRQRIIRVPLYISSNEEHILLGIVSTEPDYKLSLSLNNKLKLSLKNADLVEIEDDKGLHLNFSRFSDVKSSHDLVYSLISNRSDKSYLLKKLRKIDYFFQVQYTEDNVNVEHLIYSLKEIDGITAVFSLNPDEIKDKNLHYLIP